MVSFTTPAFEEDEMQRGSSHRALHSLHQGRDTCHDEQEIAQELDSVSPATVMRKVDLHLVPWFFTLGIACYLDRTNLSFAALQLNEDLQLSCQVYGLAAGLFFVGYAIFQMPFNMVLVRLGAPLWLGLMVMAWGGVATAFAFTTSATTFLLLRFALGMWYHLSLFYSDSELGPAYAKVATSTALAQVIGAPLAAGILAMDGLGGLRGWQWLFLLEGIPTILFGVALRLRLAPSPAKAKCLAPEERAWLQRRQDKAAADAAGEGRGAAGASQLDTMLRVVTNWRVMYLGCVWLMIAATMYGIVFWCPLLINAMFNSSGPAAKGGHHDPCSTEPEGGEGSGSSASQQQQQHHSAVIALMTAVPFAVAAAGMVWNAKLAQRANERHKHAGIPILLAGIFLGLVPLLQRAAGSPAAFVSLVLAAGCTWSFHGPFMSWPAVFLKGPEAAAGFACINSLGAVGGFLGPYMVGLLAGGSGGYGAAMAVLAVALLLSGGLILVFPVQGHTGPPPGTPEHADDDDHCHGGSGRGGSMFKVTDLSDLSDIDLEDSTSDERGMLARGGRHAEAYGGGRGLAGEQQQHSQQQHGQQQQRYIELERQPILRAQQ